MLLLAVTISMAIGVLFPQFSKIFAPYILVWLGGLLFLNLIQLNTSKLISAFVHAEQIALLSLTKVVVLPLSIVRSYNRRLSTNGIVRALVIGDLYRTWSTVRGKFCG